MINKTLSELAAAYANGAINKETYRKNRGELLRGIVAGHVPVQPIDYLPPLALEDEAAVTEPLTRIDTTPIRSVAKGNLSAESPSQAAVADKKSFPAVYIGVSTGIVILLIAAVVMFYPKPPEVQSQQTRVVTPASTSKPVATESAPANKAGEDLIADFLDENVWTDESLNGFLAKWYELSAEEQNAVINTKRMQRLTSSIYKQILEARALATIDSDKALQRQQQLIDFAQSLGIQDSRMVVE